MVAVASPSRPARTLPPRPGPVLRPVKGPATDPAGHALVCRLAALAAAEEGVAVEPVLAAGRGPAPVARARQLAIYLAHVGCGYGLRRCATLFGRDRTTARHAVRCVEDRRDDPAIDDRISELEMRARALDAGRAA